MRAAKYSSALALAALAAFIYASFDYLPIRSIMADNADVLFAEDIARDLNAGGRVFDWRLSQVTYLFPDIFIARLLAVVGVAPGGIGAAYQIVFGALLLALLYALCRLSRVDAWTPLSIATLLYLSAFIGDTISNPVTVHFGLIGEHSGMLIQVLSALICFSMLVREEAPEALACAGLFAAVFLGVISDSLAPIITLPPLVLFGAIAYRDRWLPADRLASAAATVGLGVLFGKLFSYLNPFPQDREFLHLVRAQLPGSILPSIQAFAFDLLYYASHSAISAALLVITILLYGVCARSIAKRGLRRPVGLLALTVVVSLPLTITLQLGLGLYGGIALARHWAPAVFLAVALGAIVMMSDSPRIRKNASAIVLIAAIALAGELAREMASRKGQLRPQGLFADLVKCLETHGRPGWIYIGDYWISRPVHVYTGGKFGVVPFEGDAVFSNQSNLRDIRSAAPEYLITGYKMSAEPFRRSFGEPRAVVCKVTAAGYNVEILDYSNSEPFKAYARSKATIAE